MLQKDCTTKNITVVVGQPKKLEPNLLVAFNLQGECVTVYKI